MKKIILLMTIYSLNCKERPSSEPFVSGDTFRKYSDHVLDETHKNLNTSLIKKGDTIFIATEPSLKLLDLFFNKYHQEIQHPYILITHNGDTSSPGKFKSYLEDPKIFAWFGQNCDIKFHYKFVPIPIGIENRHIGRRHFELIKKVKEIKTTKNILLYANFAVHTNLQKRQPVYNLFITKPFCYFVKKRNNVEQFLKDISSSRFILSPEGNGLDCHRTWEALYLNSIPIIKSSTLDSLFDGLPVVIINNWTEITEHFLKEKYIEITNKVYNLEKLNFDYWIELINQCKNQCKKNIN